MRTGTERHGDGFFIYKAPQWGKKGERKKQNKKTVSQAILKQGRTLFFSGFLYKKMQDHGRDSNT